MVRATDDGFLWKCLSEAVNEGGGGQLTWRFWANSMEIGYSHLQKWRVHWYITPLLMSTYTSTTHTHIHTHKQ